MSGYYELKAAGSGYVFALKADDSEILLTSHAHETKARALEEIALMQKQSAADSNYRRKVAWDGSPYFEIQSANGAVIAKSHVYESLSARQRGIDSCRECGPTTDVRDKT